MESRSVKAIVEMCGGELLSGPADLEVRRVCTDSRVAGAGDLFFALKGERFDAHDFLADVVRQGVSAVVVNRTASLRPGNSKRCAVIVVDDPRRALGRLAAKYRVEFELPVVAVAGSNGKTTTKELIASVLRQKLRTLWSEASFNNDIGVPLTLLRLEGTHEAAVLEAGTNHPGELAPLLDLIRPRFGVITNIAREHLEFFGDLEGVAREEGTLAEALPPGGALFLNGDSSWAASIANRTRARVIRVGVGPRNNWRVVPGRVTPEGSEFRVETERAEFSREFRTPLLGAHQMLNATFALAVGAELGVDAEAAAQGLAECPQPRMRMQFLDVNGIRVLDDSYNANADSMLAALQTLQSLPCQGRRIAVLGDMAELGTHSEAAHDEVGRRVAELGVHQLFVVGSMASVTARGARNAGLHRVLEFQDVEAASGAVKHFVKPGDLLLLKASRASRFERIAEQLRKESAKKNGCSIS